MSTFRKLGKENKFRKTMILVEKSPNHKSFSKIYCRFQGHDFF